MKGGLRRAAIGGAALGLLAAVAPVLSLAPSGAVHAYPSICALNTTLEVSFTAPRPNQPQLGTWTDVASGATVPRYGLYWAVTDPSAGTRAVPRQQTFAGDPVQTGDAFQWRLRSKCEGSTSFLDTAGTAIGYCGRSVGLGSGTIDTKPVTVKWESTGSTITLLDPSLPGTLSAQYHLPDSANSCDAGTETSIPVTGSLAAP
jgi:hypothetical protein